MKPPRCRCCGKPIAKATVKHLFGRDPRFLQDYEWSKDHVERPATPDDVRRLTNQQLVRHVYSDDRSYVREASTWDGESYLLIRGYFCTHSCAEMFGELAARVTPLQTQAYVDTIRALRGGSSPDG